MTGLLLVLSLLLPAADCDPVNYPQFVGAGYASQSGTADSERTVNWFVERLESQGATSSSALYPTPGVEEIAQSAYGPGRAHFFQHGREFAVFGPKFHEIGQFGLLTERGNVAIGANPATISSNGDGGGQLLITSGDNGYIYDLTSHAFTQVAFLDGKATMGDSLDGYFLALDSATSTFYISDLLDGLTWDPTMFAQRSIASDPWVSMKVNGRYVWLFGELTSEVWYDAGAGNFPFAPHPSGLVPYGINAPFTAAVADGQILWLGATQNGDRFVLRASGFTPEVVSDYALQWAFGNYNTANDATADTFNYLGHVFYRITFPSEDTTWCLDTQQGKWFEWMTWISEENKYVACRAQWHAMAFGEHRMLDSQTGSVYRMNQNLGFDVDGRPIRRLRRAPCLFAENERVYISSFELDLEPGLGLSFGPGGGIEIVAGVNDHIDINIGAGTLATALVAPRVYVTANDLCTAVVAALDAHQPGLWVCTFNRTISRFSLGSISGFGFTDILFGSGANTVKSIAATMGFTAADINTGDIKEAEGPPIVADSSGIDPQVMMRQSRNGGKTWGTERMRSAGKSGEYGKRVRWERCGMARRMTFEVSTSDPIPYRIAAALITLAQPLKNAQPQAQRQG